MYSITHRTIPTSKLPVVFKTIWIFLLVLSLFLMAMMLTTITHANAALTAITANTIQGTKPYLLLSDGKTRTNLDELLSFTMWDGTYNDDGSKHMAQVSARQASAAIVAPSEFSYNDVLTLVTPNDGTPQDLVGLMVGDDDGDATIAENTSISGKMVVVWKNGEKVVTNLDQALSSCGGPYTLDIKIPTQVIANTTYGTPNTKNYGTRIGVTYTFMQDGIGICNLRPESHQTYTTNVTIPGGYNPTVWEYDESLPIIMRHKGFKASSGFPSTGFKGAIFTIMGSGNNQNRYRCTTDDIDKIGLSTPNGTAALGKGCKITYKSETKSAFTSGGTPTIIMEYNTTGTKWVEIDRYTIPEPKLWATVKGPAQYNTKRNYTGSYSAATLCDPSFSGTGLISHTAASNYFFKRNELTNSPAVDSGYATYNGSEWIQIGTTNTGGYFSRDIGTFMGEWGDLENGGYANSGFDAGVSFIWTAESYSSIYQFGATSLVGGVNASSPTSINLTVCR